MRYITFTLPENSKYPIALLCKSLKKNDLKDFVQGMEQDVVAYSIPNEKKPKVSDIREYLAKLLPVLCGLQTDYLVVTDAAYFKVLTKVQRVDRFYGYVLPCTLENYTHLNVIYVPSPGALIYDPNQKSKLTQGLNALKDHRKGAYTPPGSTIIHFQAFPHTVEEIKSWLQRLLDVPLAIDIETFSLKHHDAGIGTITMCWSQHEGIAFCIDKGRSPKEAQEIRSLLKMFFEARTAVNLYHRASFDVYILIYQLFMQDVLDTEGMLYGLEIMFRNFEDTQLIRYLATNSCAGNKLSLKDVAQEFAGNYAVDVGDISIVPRGELMSYNLIDGMSTWYAYNKHYAQMVADQQLDIYTHLFKQCLVDIVQMQLTGLPVNMEEVKKGKVILQQHSDKAFAGMMRCPAVRKLEQLLCGQYAEKMNNEWKVKRATPAEMAGRDETTFNPNSPIKLQKLLYEIMQLPIISLTDTKQPSTDGDTIEALINHTTDQSYKDFLQYLIDYKNVHIILTTFIPAFENAYLASDGHHYLFGGFNLGGTLSGRLSSSDPNLQNLPATGSEYAKLIKKMFMAPKGKLFVGLDFNSLEDRISALTTKDPNKLKVYTDGFDGHSLRAVFYWRDQFPHIDIDDPKQVNQLKKQDHPLRQKSKAPTFALTYQGTYRTLMTNCGFSKVDAQEIETRYHEMYAVSDKWVQDRLTVAAKVGYVTVAFGLRLRTPMMQQTVMGIRATPYEAEAEGRTAGNAMGQSYCMLNSRAAMAFMKKVRKHPVYRTRIRICAQIHDAMYFIIDNDVELLEWLNIHLVEEVKWQKLPEIQHPDVKLGGELTVFYPSWADELTIPNGADTNQIYNLAKEHMKS